MKIPKRILPLVEEGLVDDVLAQLKGGKEASVYVVTSGEKVLCAKVYKEAAKRSFKHTSQYTEGRRIRGSRRARAMSKNTRFGRQEAEEEWQNFEVDILYRLAAAGVQVPKIHGFSYGVLLMDLVVDAEGDPAPRLSDVDFDHATARDYHERLIREIVRMLCAGVIHGDLSEYNVLAGISGPVVIDLPQAVYASDNNSAMRILERDVDNMTAYFGRFAPELIATEYAKEIWGIYKRGELTPEVALTGRVKARTSRTDVESVMRAIRDAKPKPPGEDD